jgi:hypothetical protein
VNSPEDGPVGPKHVEIRRYMNKIEIVTSVGFSFHMLKRCMVQKALKKGGGNIYLAAGATLNK